MTTANQMKEVAYLHKVFNEADRNSDGKITIKEVVETLYVIGYGCTENDVDEMYSTYDRTVDFPDFLKILFKRIKMIDDQDTLQKAFQEFDDNKDGKVDSVEFKRMILSMGNFNENEVDEMIKDMKPDAKGVVDYQAFITSLKAK